MKSFKRAMSLALVLVLALSIMCIPGIADAGNTQNLYSQFKNYMCVGDSISAGNTLGDGTNDVGFTRVEGAYHSIIADTIGANLLQFGCSAFRVVELRYILDGVYTDTDGLWNMAFARAFEVDNLDLLAPSYIKAIKQADLMTINLGSNDVLSYTVIRVMANMAEKTSNPRIDELKANLEKTGNIGAALLGLIQLFENLGEINTLVSEINASLTEAYNNFEQNWKASIKEIYKLNPDVTIIAVGAYNAFNNVVISEGSRINLGLLFQPTINKINRLLKNGSYYTGEYIFADVEGTPIYGLSLDDPNLTTNMMHDVHPTRDGHAFMAKQILEVIPKTLPFNDVKKGDWCHDYVLYCYENGLMNGVSDTMFSPNSTMTRGMVAAVLYRIAGSPSVSYLSEPFRDVTGGNFYNAIVWAYNNRIINGYNDGTFKPNTMITREQFATMLYRYALTYGYAKDSMLNQSALLAFTDAGSISSFAKNAMGWAVARGIVQGKTINTIVPQGNATRAECATMLARFDKLINA